MKSPITFSRLVTAFLMSLIMSSVVSGVVTFMNLGISTEFLIAWLKAVIIAFPVAFFTLLLIRPMVEKIVRKWFPET